MLNLDPMFQPDAYFWPNLISTAAFLIIIAFCRVFVLRVLKKADFKWSRARRTKWLGHIKTAFLFISVMGVVYIWAEVGATLLSLSAILVALVIASKELLMCVHGAFIRLKSDAYDIGDRIEINGIRGDVLEIGILFTTVAELSKGDSQLHTGRVTVVPNSVLLTQNVQNESALKDFLFHSIKIPLKKTDDWERGQKLLLDIANEQCQDILDQVRHNASHFGHERAMAFPAVDPKVNISLPDPNNIILKLRFPAKLHEKNDLEQRILTEFLNQF